MDNMALSEFAAARRAAARLLLTRVYSRHLFFLGGGEFPSPKSYNFPPNGC